jgi:hypothetical protein
LDDDEGDEDDDGDDDEDDDDEDDDADDDLVPLFFNGSSEVFLVLAGVDVSSRFNSCMVSVGELRSHANFRMEWR